MRRSRRISYLTQSYETSSSQEKGEFCCGGHPHVPRHPPQADRPRNPFLDFVDERPSPVIEPHRCDTVSIRSRPLRI